MASTYKRPKGRALLGKVATRSLGRFNKSRSAEKMVIRSAGPQAQALASIAHLPFYRAQRDTHRYRRAADAGTGVDGLKAMAAP